MKKITVTVPLVLPILEVFGHFLVTSSQELKKFGSQVVDLEIESSGFEGWFFKEEWISDFFRIPYGTFFKVSLSSFIYLFFEKLTFSLATFDMAFSLEVFRSFCYDATFLVSESMIFQNQFRKFFGNFISLFPMKSILMPAVPVVELEGFEGKILFATGMWSVLLFA